MITINELHSKTGLKITFIRKCVKELNEILEPHIQRGNYNSINFSPNAFVIFDKIKQLKDEGLIITDIKRRLEKELKDDKSGESKELKVHQTPFNPSKDDKSQAIETLGNQILDLQEQLVREKEKTFQEIQKITLKKCVDIALKNNQRRPASQFALAAAAAQHQQALSAQYVSHRFSQ